MQKTVVEGKKTLKNVSATLNADIHFLGGKEFLRRMLRKISFKFKKCKNKGI
jgi:hypothetical protein